MPHPAAHSRQVLANHVATPGMTSVGWTRYGISRSVGGAAHPVTVPATPRPRSFRKSRRSKTTASDTGRPLVVTDHAIHRGRVLRIVHVLAMAVEAPAHLERRVLVHDRHRLDRAVAG